MVKKPINEIEVIREISTIIKDQNLSEIEIERDGVKIRVQNQSMQTNQVSQVVAKIIAKSSCSPTTCSCS